MTWDEVTERLKNLEEKISNHEQLTEDDGLDMVYLPMFSPINKAEQILERILQLFEIDESLEGSFRYHVAFGLSIMVKKYFGPTPKTEELLKMLEKNVENSRLRMVAEFEADFERQLFERKLAEKDAEIEAINSKKDAEIEAINSKKDAEIEAINSKKDAEIQAINSKKDAEIEAINSEINALKAKLEANGIDY